MIVLGIGGSTHDFGAAVVVDGQVRVAIEEERLSRIKHHSLERLSVDALRLRSVDYCLAAIGATLDDVDVVVANDLVFRGVLRALPRVRTVSHHVAHAALAGYLSPHDDPAVLIVDGFGSIADDRADTVSYFVAGPDGMPQLVHREAERLHRLRPDRQFSWKNYDFVENSLGELYNFVTVGIGFGVHDAGKTMGLAPYGSGRLVERFAELVEVDDVGRVRFEPDVRRELGALVEAERDAGVDHWSGRAELALGVQSVLERALCRRVADIHRRTGRTALAVGGGVFLNSVANALIRDTGPFGAFWLHGATGDSGTAVGAALLAYHQASGRPPRRDQVLYPGRPYSRAETLTALRDVDGINWSEGGDAIAHAVDVLAAGGVVGWFQGGSEMGPRALGNRSILADPSRPEMKDRINAVVKHREAFRPFAPSVLRERQAEVLDSAETSLYMCVNAQVRPDALDLLRAAGHVDGSARYQTVDRELNPRFHELIRRFADRTGVPAVLNTSFNDNEPIVETPRDALRCFLSSDIDCLVIDDVVVTRCSPALPPSLGAVEHLAEPAR
jgi:carbamoyltransferase